MNEMTRPGFTDPQRLLIAIASFGDKNLDHLRSIIRRYQGMRFDTKVVVVSDRPKDLGSAVDVVVGLPIRNPWSLPFAHKQVFAENADNFDLFLYSEDDMDVSEDNIQAFLDVTPELDSDEIAGYLRYEIDAVGNRSFPEIHGAFHWKPQTVFKRGSQIIAEFSNEHAAFYILNRSQLKKCIASGGYLRPPYEGRYDMLCTAATDPYTNCGFRKVICISNPTRFLIHHRPNRYAGKLGISQSDFDLQLEILHKIAGGLHPATSLGVKESKLRNINWSKGYYENPTDEFLKLIPSNAKTVLSLGCGSGNTEEVLQSRGHNVTALPLDSVIGAVAARRGIRVIHGDWCSAIQEIDNEQFDAVLLTNLLHLFPTPKAVVTTCASFVGQGGVFVAQGPNFGRLPILTKRILRKPEFNRIGDYSASGISLFGKWKLRAWARAAGLRPAQFSWLHAASHTAVSGAYSGGELFRRKIIGKLLQRLSLQFGGDRWLMLCVRD